MWRVIFAGLACLTLCACNSGEAAAHKAALERLKDPDSARFGKFTVSKDGKKACLGVNAKNSYGGYTGEHQVVLSKNSSAQWEWVDELDEVFSHSECVNMINS